MPLCDNNLLATIWRTATRAVANKALHMPYWPLNVFFGAAPSSCLQSLRTTLVMSSHKYLGCGGLLPIRGSDWTAWMHQWEDGESMTVAGRGQCRKAGQEEDRRTWNIIMYVNTQWIHPIFFLRCFFSNMGFVPFWRSSIHVLWHGWAAAFLYSAYTVDVSHQWVTLKTGEFLCSHVTPRLCLIGQMCQQRYFDNAETLDKNRVIPQKE